jgi:DNA polymerase lambda
MGICRRSPEDKVRRIGKSTAGPREPLADPSIPDILTIPEHQWGAALVYFTGTDIVSCSPLSYRPDLNLGCYQFNRSMRLLANKKGLSLNQRGLWSGVIRDPKTGQKTAAGEVLSEHALLHTDRNSGVVIASRTEKEIFAALGVPWKEPHERVCS